LYKYYIVQMCSSELLDVFERLASLAHTHLSIGNCSLINVLEPCALHRSSPVAVFSMGNLVQHPNLVTFKISRNSILKTCISNLYYWSFRVHVFSTDVVDEVCYWSNIQSMAAILICVCCELLLLLVFYYCACACVWHIVYFVWSYSLRECLLLKWWHLVWSLQIQEFCRTLDSDRNSIRVCSSVLSTVTDFSTV
jgi:hypothetical protein